MYVISMDDRCITHAEGKMNSTYVRTSKVCVFVCVCFSVVGIILSQDVS